MQTTFGTTAESHTVQLLYLFQQNPATNVHNIKMKPANNECLICALVRITSSPLTVKLSWLENAYLRPIFFSGGGLTSEVGQTNVVFGL